MLVKILPNGKMVLDGVEQSQPERPLPSNTEMASNFAQALAAHTKTFFSKATEEETLRRKTLCESCEFYRNSDGRCSVCGCYMKVKSTWQSASCPKGKW